MANRDVLGHHACPVCGFAHQEIRKATNGKPYIICDECGAQVFARQQRSVAKLREWAAAAPVSQPEKIEAKKPEPEKIEPEKPGGNWLDSLWPAGGAA